MTIKIFLSYNGTLKEYEIEENLKIEELKLKIEKEENILQEYQVLKTKEKYLYENTIKENNIEENETIYLFKMFYEDVEENEEEEKNILW